MTQKLNDNLRDVIIETSVPCRIDMGGTLDLAIFYNPLRHLSPCTANIAVNLRTVIKLLPYQAGQVKVSSRGFKSAQFAVGQAPFNHPLGLIFATADFFQADGIHVIIESQSPPRSALGGSSAALVALTAAFLMVSQKRSITPEFRRYAALLAHRIEESVAGVSCGRQDHLAAAFGGVNAWYWQPKFERFDFKQAPLYNPHLVDELRRHILLAYCGVPHVSKDVNGRWVHQFLNGEYRSHWHNIINLTKKFVDALAGSNYKEAAEAMTEETTLRREMTPDVLDEIGIKLSDAARSCECGARFTGAGGGGCIWALGDMKNIDRLRPMWSEILSERDEACLLDFKIDTKGLV
jgi:D-glycero-alpha-D-manno-heptose-7-phosphate kinase